MKYYIIAIMAILLPLSVMTMSAGKKVIDRKHEYPVPVIKVEKPMPDQSPFISIHAGADEMYPDMGYDEDGWSLRGYMSAAEMRAEHIKDYKTKQKFVERKKKVIRDFIDSMSYKAKRICRKYNVPPSILVAQAYLESGYGTSRLAVTANNYFGHMSHRISDERGIVGRVKAFDRNVNGKLKTYYFRKYESQWWSMYHHVNLIERGYAHRKIKAATKREAYMAALCGCKDSRMLASDAKTTHDKGGYLYAGACAWTAKDGKTSRYVAELKYIINLFELDKLDE